METKRGKGHSCMVTFKIILHTLKEQMLTELVKTIKRADLEMDECHLS